MENTFSRSLDILTSALAAIASLFIFIFMLGGPAYFLDLLLGSVFHILVISASAGLIRFPFRRGGAKLSIIIGAAVAAIGFFIVLGIAVSNI